VALGVLLRADLSNPEYPLSRLTHTSVHHQPLPCGWIFTCYLIVWDVPRRDGRRACRLEASWQSYMTSA
jgi:hypothetical protein